MYSGWTYPHPHLALCPTRPITLVRTAAPWWGAPSLPALLQCRQEARDCPARPAQLYGTRPSSTDSVFSSLYFLFLNYWKPAFNNNKKKKKKLFVRNLTNKAFTGHIYVGTENYFLEILLTQYLTLLKPCWRDNEHGKPMNMAKSWLADTEQAPGMWWGPMPG